MTGGNEGQPRPAPQFRIQLRPDTGALGTKTLALGFMLYEQSLILEATLAQVCKSQSHYFTMTYGYDPKLRHPASITCLQVIYVLLSPRKFRKKRKLVTPLIECVLRANYRDKCLTQGPEAVTNFLRTTEPTTRQADTGNQAPLPNFALWPPDTVSAQKLPTEVRQII